jgi:D-cysteine desulfhydrase
MNGNVFPRSPVFMHPGLSDMLGLEIWVKDDSQLPFSGGGSTKFRKARAIFEEASRLRTDCIVTTGSPHSNHIRAVAVLANQHNWNSFIFVHDRELDPSEQFLPFLLEYGVQVAYVELAEVRAAMTSKVEELRLGGRTPFSIHGGGHSLAGAYGVYLGAEELRDEEGLPHFEAVCVASGTGGTQAGLHCSISRWSPKTRCIGISIAREASRGRRIVDELVEDLDVQLADGHRSAQCHFDDRFTLGGYGQHSKELLAFVSDLRNHRQFKTDPTYTGKALFGLGKMIRNGELGSTGPVLFWHTGGIRFPWG